MRVPLAGLITTAVLAAFIVGGAFHWTTLVWWLGLFGLTWIVIDAVEMTGRRER